MTKTSYEFQWGERCSLLVAQCFCDNFGPYLFGAPPQHIDYAIVSENRYNETFASKTMLAEWHRLAPVMLQSRRRAALLKSSSQTRARLHLLFKQFSRLNLPGLSNRELLKLVQKFYQLISHIVHHFTLSDAPSTNALTVHLRQALSAVGLERELPLLVTQTVPDILAREQRDLARLGAKKNVSDTELHRHAVTYAILFYNSYNLAENLTYLAGRLKEKFNYDEKLAEMKHLRCWQETIFKKLKNKEIKTLCLFFQTLGVDRLELKNSWAGAEFRFLPLFKEIARRVYLPLTTMLGTFALDDYRQALVGGVSYTVDQVSSRLANFVWWKKGRRLRLLERPEEMKPFLQLKKSLAQAATDTVIGTSANGGTARGVVRIVKSLDIQNMLKDLERFSQGDILVTWMTQPNMVPIARRAAAIIADEGGITSHAAVIAREFGLPCIVGAKMATKVFKDGDKVEVDGDTGTVRLIK